MIITAKDLLCRCREESCMTLQQVAEKAGVSITSMCDWERGMHEPRFNAVIWCLTAMGFGLKLYRLKDE